ncbi:MULTISPECIES: UxaA family hydrolase [Acutalibacteraceae]|uniref:UxaA family hydrolase n=1 Tax=Acutalibacteraceae TaxID=3082771 RepID=UPI0013E89960|nr:MULTISPECIES: UxaA family hydrolase [Acutalibacteraceae]
MVAVLIDPKDNVAVVLDSVKEGQEVFCRNGAIQLSIKAKSDVPRYHKISVCKIGKGDAIVKYGEHIGVAAEEIEAGVHVHLQNVQSRREAL